jgi:hypothetical protein
MCEYRKDKYSLNSLNLLQGLGYWQSTESSRNGDNMDSNERLQTLAKLMSTDRHQRLAIDYLPAHEHEPDQERYEELEMA